MLDATTNKKVSAVSSAPALSVIIPLYQAEAYIEQCLGSLLAQTFGDFEALCIDDASPDCSFERAKAFVGKDPRFRFFKQPENRGQAAARNVGLDHARGDYIVFLDSDDYFVETALEKMIDRCRTQNLDHLYFSAESFYETRKAARCLREEYDHSFQFDGVVDGQKLFVLCVTKGEFWDNILLRVVRRDLFNTHKLRFHEGIIHEDVPITYQVLLASKRCSLLNEPLYCRRVREGSTMTSDNALKRVNGRFYNIKLIEELLKEYAHELKSDFISAITDVLMTYKTEAGTIWNTALQKADQRAYLESLLPTDRVLFTNEIIGTTAAVDEVYQSRTYRLGNAFAGIPRALCEKGKKRPWNVLHERSALS